MNENMKRHVILLEREKKAIIFNWEVFRLHPLLQHMTIKRDKFKLTENSQNYSRS